LSSGNKYLILIVFLFSIILYSCGGKNSENKKKIDYENPQVVLQQAQSVLGNNVKFAYKGTFDNDSKIEIAAGIEVQNSKEWGIKFALLKMEDGNLTQTYISPLLNGSFNQCLFQKIKFPMFGYELGYYNSQDYYLGSGGGEVYSYIINFKEGKVYYAHLISGPRRPISLYLSKNIDSKEIKNFFMSNFKRDFPSYSLIDKDIEMKN
jgi:hypothetical protein